MRYLDKYLNIRNPNPFKKTKHRKNFPKYKAWLRFDKMRDKNDPRKTFLDHLLNISNFH